MPLLCRRPRRAALLALALPAVLSAAALVPQAAQAQAVLTQNNDNARTGANTQETALTPYTVTAARFGKRFTISGLDANVNGQPLYVPGVTLGGARHNVLCVYTSDNADHSPCSVYAFDADGGQQLWHTTLPNSATFTTATPAIDQAAGNMYVLTKTDTDDLGSTYLHVFDITTGAERPGSPVQVRASATGRGDGNVGGVVSFDGPASSGRFHADERTGLLLLNGTVYTAYAHNSDSYPYHGWVLGYKYGTGGWTQTVSFCTTPDGGDGGIWQSGKGLTADGQGYIYCSVGNGTFDANTGGRDYGMCYLKLTPDLKVVDYFSPFDEQAQSNQDLDTGNSGLTLLPGTNRLFGGATKFGTGFLLDSSALGGFTAGGPDKVLDRLDGLTGYDSVGQNPVSFDAGGARYVYLWANGSELEQFRYDPNVGTFSPTGVYKKTSGLTSGGSLAVSAAGTAGGLLWGVGGDGVVRAFDAVDVSKAPVWTSAQDSARDGLGSVGHFQFPTIVAGKVYVPTGDGRIIAYGLLPGAQPQTANILWDRTDGTMSMWDVAADNSFSHREYGPYSGYTAQAVADGPDGRTRVLWDRSDGTMSVWNLDNVAGAFTHHEFGPYAGYTAKAVSVGADNTTHVLWDNSSGLTSVWDYSTAGGTFSHQEYGPYAGYAAQAIADGPDGRTRILWDRSDGLVSVWSLDNVSGQFSHQEFGPYAGYTAKAVSVGPDNATRILWGNTDGHMSLWNYSTGDGSFTQNTYGPYGGWSAAAVGVGADGAPRVLWNYTDGTMSLWRVDAGGGFTFTNYGPYSGWTAVGIAGTP